MAFQPSGSSCAERMPATSREVASVPTCPTSASQKSRSSRRWRSKARGERTAGSSTWASRLPSSSTVPTAAAIVTVLFAVSPRPERSAERGMRTDISSGERGSYAACGGR